MMPGGLRVFGGMIRIIRGGGGRVGVIIMGIMILVSRSCIISLLLFDVCCVVVLCLVVCYQL